MTDWDQSSNLLIFIPYPYPNPSPFMFHTLVVQISYAITQLCASLLSHYLFWCPFAWFFKIIFFQILFALACEHAHVHTLTYTHTHTRTHTHTLSLSLKILFNDEHKHQSNNSIYTMTVTTSTFQHSLLGSGSLMKPELEHKTDLYHSQGVYCTDDCAIRYEVWLSIQVLGQQQCP